MAAEKEQALAVFKNIKAVLGAGLFFGEHAAVIHQCQVFIEQLIAQNEADPLKAVPDLEEVEDPEGLKKYNEAREAAERLEALDGQTE